LDKTAGWRVFWLIGVVGWGLAIFEDIWVECVSEFTTIIPKFFGNGNIAVCEARKEDV
jgi:hypothetical protein